MVKNNYENLPNESYFTPPNQSPAVLNSAAPNDYFELPNQQQQQQPSSAAPQSSAEPVSASKSRQPSKQQQPPPLPQPPKAPETTEEQKLNKESERKSVKEQSTEDHLWEPHVIEKDGQKDGNAMSKPPTKIDQSVNKSGEELGGKNSENHEEMVKVPKRIKRFADIQQHQSKRIVRSIYTATGLLISIGLILTIMALILWFSDCFGKCPKP